jgi:DNA-directed RNA polymerase subunit RPC12/RpoP
MPESVIMLLDADDRALHAGRTIPINVNGATVYLALSGKRLRLDDAAPNGGPALTHKVPPSASQRGDCPYCDHKDVLISPHIRKFHREKPPVWLGPNPVKCARCGGTFASVLARDVHARQHDHPHALKKSGGKKS